MLTDGGNQAPNFEMYFIIGVDDNAEAEEANKLEQEHSKFNDIIQISAAETFFSFGTQGTIIQHITLKRTQRCCDFRKIQKLKKFEKKNRKIKKFRFWDFFLFLFRFL